MAWNEPGKNDKDPWGRQKNSGSDLDALLKDFQKFFKDVFNSNIGGNNTEPPSKKNISFLVSIIFAIYLLSGIYIVDDGERGVVLQFGKFNEITLPGPHWIPRVIQTVEIVDVAKIRSVQQKAVMLTEDENIVSINFAIQYDIKDASNYIFNLREPDITLRQAGESAIREVLGKNSMDFIITEGREEIASRTKLLLQSVLDSYISGINVQTVNILEAQPPEQVQDAFSDAIKAREDEQRFINEAEAYRNEIIPLARGKAKQIIEESKAYKVKLINSAEGEASRFKQLYKEYQKAPEVTRERLYLEAVESVLENSSKVMIDIDGGNNLMYLPLDKIISSTPQQTNKPQRYGSESADSLSDKIESNKDSFNLRKRDLYNE
ncbi:MAG: FtsH protease activity modulator HflK [Gammaproteobacteria bacterium]|nr:FtsH protease activity modulator HflK [Gammaproteobacteria bacterium]|tara:strand:+ start:248650 stop:249783 length:1134 start_codon:yes stop_codon:yes gene_type:complete